MAALLAGLDGRLRVSGMVADSIMMGIVNSSMEDAYRKSCSKEGELERLKEKSRFCELAAMQLQWCLTYLKDQQINPGLDRDQLFHELLETRDRIRNRLDDTDVAIAEKDVELARGKESELKLRLREEVLNTTCTCSSASFDPSPRRVFEDLRSSASRKIEKMRRKVEEGRAALKSLMVHNCGDGDGERPSQLQGYNSVAQLNLDLEEIVFETESLEDEFASSFETIANSVSSFKAAMEERRQTWNIEREIVSIVVTTGLKEFQHQFNSMPVVRPFFLDTNWLDITGEIRNLLDELEALSSHLPRSSTVSISELRSQRSLPLRIDDEQHVENRKIERKTSGNCSSIGEGDDGHYDDVVGASTKVEKQKGNEDSSAEARPPSQGHSIADLIRSHESIIRKKMEESNWRELSKEKMYASLRNDGSFDSLREIVDKIIQKLSSIEGMISRFVEGRRDRNFFANARDIDNMWLNWSDFETPHAVFDRSDRISSCRSSDDEFLHREEEEFKALIFEQTSKILLKDVLHNYSHVIEEFKEKEENSAVQQHIREGIDLTVYGEVVKGIYETVKRLRATETLVKDLRMYQHLNVNTCSSVNIESEHQARELTLHDVEVGEQVSTTRVIKDSSEEQFSTPRVIEDSIEEQFSTPRVIKESSEEQVSTPHVIKDSSEEQVSIPRVIKNSSEEQVSTPCVIKDCSEEQVSTARVIKDNSEEQVSTPRAIKDSSEEQVSTPRVIEDSSEVQHLPFNFEELIVLPLEEFLVAIEDCERTTFERLGANVSRLMNIVLQLNSIAEQLKTVKQNELLYQKAFTRRCYDLQTAEAEVDLLGDEVDILLSLIEKIHFILDHYSPVLKHYSGVLEVLELIDKYGRK